ncbi:hypothetical protein K353_05845 [Kitasatospora sp. SolWspMP-SS2h]|uniref:hypothetical protein n=1 Tax=Kitasatospora sp. SolWspMP-SS2h TaxID=1305729 RepID=UPI000DC0260C|nr:hypothetical protein [Kitasatospora sp. SolWspMP-SS2h]RAJ32847.1 hypothetical protein K353_05845 [Kitasatospora sp. SolWspMP-SS2h]
MKTLVEQNVVEELQTGGDEPVRLYVAACAERMAPLFIALRTGETGRETDVELYTDSVAGLWQTDRLLSDAAERAHLLDRFPELQSTEDGITDVVGTYTFFACLVLRYVLLANGSGSADHAVSCGHAALTAMGMLDQNIAGAAFQADEQRLQTLSASGNAAGIWDASMAAGRERLRAVLSRVAKGTR